MTRLQQLADLAAKIKVARAAYEAKRRILWQLEERRDRLQTEQRLEDFDKRNSTRE